LSVAVACVIGVCSEHTVKDNVVTGFALIVLFVGCGFGLTLAPRLQDAQLSVDVEASRGVEKARRLLSRFNANLERIAQVLEVLREQKIDIDLAEVEGRLESDEFLAVYQDELDVATREFATVSGERPHGEPSSQIREGIRTRRKLIEENDRLLADALNAVNAALSVSRGSADASSHRGANRLKGWILFFQGESAARRAARARAGAVPVRGRIAALAARVEGLRPQTSFVADIAIDERIAELTAELEKQTAAVDAVRGELSAVDERIAELERELASAKASAASARAAMEQLKADGIDFADSEGFQNFAASYEASAAQYRSALSRIHAIERGTMPEAKIDDSGDYINGRYLQNGSPENLTTVSGLAHYRAERERLAAAVKTADDSVSESRGDLDRLRESRDVHRRRESEASQAVADAQAQAQTAYDQLRRINAEAFAAEEEAIRRYAEAANTFGAAERAAGEWVRDAAEKTRALSPEAEALSAFTPQADDGWIGGHITTERAAAEAGQAWTYYQRFAARSRDADLLSASAQVLALGGADAEAERTAADEAREQGIEAVGKALDRLERAHDALGRNWAVTAQYAGTAYLLVLFGEQGRLNDVIANYRNAISGREEETCVLPFRDRLAKLENM